MSTITVGENKGKDKEAIMEKAQISVIRGIGVFVAFFLFLLSVGETQGAPPKPFVVECPGGSIQAELDGLQPGETLTVSGTCNERVIIEEQFHNITLDGQGTATINGPNPSQSTILVRARGIIIKGFTITGGSSGILVVRGGAVRIIDNTIENNTTGIFLTENSTARIGFLRGSDTVARPNRIQNNFGDGIRVQRSSSARIVGNMITGNDGDGIEVRRVSHAEISDNVIDDNRRRGINVNGNGGVDLGRSSGGTIFELPNNTTFIGRQDVGIRCRNDSYIRGRLGTLTGAPLGQVDASGSCNVDVGP